MPGQSRVEQAQSCVGHSRVEQGCVGPGRAVLAEQGSAGQKRKPTRADFDKQGLACTSGISRAAQYGPGLSWPEQGNVAEG